ncbi:hypothetical protein KC19_1G017400 [Ceratodon purpureus]|uniref:acyl-CoA oxidase n=1 Tax=Ceratodon purpureus TaxID=3225 RepID=A0A8T0J349_CERPU|nr:hypothetical protein KC19_1G017400 [Ceratodon purpureus]
MADRLENQINEMRGLLDNEVAQRRLDRHASHLCNSNLEQEEQLSRELCAKLIKRPLNPSVLANLMAGGYPADRDHIFNFFISRPDLETPVEISKDAHRELAYKQMLAIVNDAGVNPMKYLMEDPARYFTLAEAVGFIDMSLGIKFGKHRDKYAEGISSLKYPGCFAMTELHHGIQTTATFDRLTNEFVINTPNEGATKWWIGNAAVHGKFASVFARLKLPSPDSHLDTDMGVHAFIVPIRSMENHSVLPGIEIRDCGYKVGLNGVDNGALRFRNVRVPRDNLLNRFGDVSKDGEYTSILPTINKRFAATLGELVGGRVGLAYGSVGVLKAASTIAIRYSLIRQQFGPPNKEEVSILDYQSQQQKLMPMLSSAYAFHFATEYLVDRYSEMKKTHDDEVIADSCGGHGYAAVNRFGALRNDHDIFQTFEGDNTVLLQQVAGDLLKQYKRKFEGGALSVTWTYLKDSMGTYLSQTNPVSTHREGTFEYVELQLGSIWTGCITLSEHSLYRTARLLHTAALRLRKHSKRLGSFGAWNRCLNHLLTLAESHIESVILAKFSESVERCEDKQTRKVLNTVRDLYALDRIWKDIGRYLAVVLLGAGIWELYGYNMWIIWGYAFLIQHWIEAIHRLVEYLSFELKGVAGSLVDGFGIPDALLRAPIGLQSNQYAEYIQYIGFE